MEKRGGRGESKRGNSTRENKKAQIMGMPFQFIFALILVAVALFVGFFVIKMFLDRAEQANINLFVQNTKDEVSDLWQADSAEKVSTFILSRNFDSVCFLNQSKPCNSATAPPDSDFCNENLGYKMWVNSDKDNLFLVPLGKAEHYDTWTSWHIVCGTKECINFTANPLCIPVEDGKVLIKLTKESGNSFVKISKP